MARRKLELKKIKVTAIPDNIDYTLLDLLFKDIRFISYQHNENNQLINDECWVRGDDSLAYTTLKYNGKVTKAHRVSYEIFKGKILLNYGCHHCDVPACINPNHIFDGTHKQNNWDARRKYRTFSIGLSRIPRIDRAERKLREQYPNQKVRIQPGRNDLSERFKRLIGDT